MASQPVVGLIGVGLMGHGIARNVAAKGFDLVVLEHPGNQPLDELRALGATNALTSRRSSLTGRGRFAAAATAYETHRTAAGLPATWEIISAMAWAPEPGAPIREGGADLVAVPVSKIPIRRRG